MIFCLKRLRLQSLYLIVKGRLEPACSALDNVRLMLSIKRSGTAAA